MKRTSIACALTLLLASSFVFSENTEEIKSKSENELAVEKEKPLQYFGLSFENDAYFRDDDLYTNGTFVYWGYHDLDTLDKTTLPTWLSYLTGFTHLSGDANKSHDVSYSIGQVLQTPVDFENEALIEDDVPFVALLAWNARIQSFDDVIDDQMGLTLGVVGPMAGGEFVQKTIHSVIGASEPMGWDHQIDNEFVARLDALRKWRLYEHSFSSTEFDFIGGAGGGAGNLKSDLSAGMTVRWGTSLQKSYAAAPIFSTQQFNALKPNPFGWYLFANLTGSYVFNDIFMDGNTFKDSHHVDLINEQLAFSFGVMVNFYDWNVIYSSVILSDQYEEQVETSRFGSINISYQF